MNLGVLSNRPLRLVFWLKLLAAGLVGLSGSPWLKLLVTRGRLDIYLSDARDAVSFRLSFAESISRALLLVGAFNVLMGLVLFIEKVLLRLHGVQLAPEVKLAPVSPLVRQQSVVVRLLFFRRIDQSQISQLNSCWSC